MAIIDFHAHIFPDQIAGRAIVSLSEAGEVPAFTNGTLGGLIASMDKAGIDKSVTVPIATKPEQVKSINDFAIELTRNPRIVSFGTLHPKYQDFAAEIGRLKAAGVKGIKFHPEYQEFYPDDKKMFPLYQALAEQNLIAFFHAGWDIAYPDVHGTPDCFARVIDNFPGLKIVLAHLGSYLMWDLVKRHLVGKNVYFDTSFTLDYLEPDKVREIIALHDQDKILFGTDSPWKDQAEEVAKLKKVISDKQTQEKILSENAQQLLGL